MFEILTLTGTPIKFARKFDWEPLQKGWANTWLYPEDDGEMTPETFPSRRSAKAALDEFFAEAAEEIAIGQRSAQALPRRQSFRISPVGRMAS